MEIILSWLIIDLTFKLNSLKFFKVERSCKSKSLHMLSFSKSNFVKLGSSRSETVTPLRLLEIVSFAANNDYVDLDELVTSLPITTSFNLFLKSFTTTGSTFSVNADSNYSEHQLP